MIEIFNLILKNVEMLWYLFVLCMGVRLFFHTVSIFTYTISEEDAFFQTNKNKVSFFILWVIVCGIYNYLYFFG